MKRIIPALAAFLAIFGGCTDSQTELVLAGLDNPICSSTTTGAATTSVPEEAFEQALTQQVLFGELSRVVALDVLNELKSPAQTDALNNPTNTASRDDITLTAVEITVTDLSGASVATETLPIGAYVPSGGTKDIISFDVMGKPLADALRAQFTLKPPPGPEKLLVKVVVHGTVVSGGELDSNPYTFPMQVNFDNSLFTESIPGTSAFNTITILPDGGAADAVLLGDGTLQLGTGAAGTNGAVTVADAGNPLTTRIHNTYSEAQVGADGGVTLPPGVAACE
ncbi:MAG: hypothetical protein JST54_02625 [Deltaproteobacteria bacterium]|nr:hypothetical protein [Deltaproteobacteria bacterium]